MTDQNTAGTGNELQRKDDQAREQLAAQREAAEGQIQKQAEVRDQLTQAALQKEHDRYQEWLAAKGEVQERNQLMPAADLPPAASLFDHVIVEARLQGTTIWLDATLTQQRGSPLGRAPGNFGVALPVADGASDLVKVVVPDTAADRLKVVEHLRPGASEKGIELEIARRVGIARAPLWQVREQVEAGSVELVLTEFEPEPAAVHLVWPSGRALPRRVRALVDFLAERISTQTVRGAGIG